MLLYQKSGTDTLSVVRRGFIFDDRIRKHF